MLFAHTGLYFDKTRHITVPTIITNRWYMNSCSLSLLRYMNRCLFSLLSFKYFIDNVIRSYCVASRQRTGFRKIGRFAFGKVTPLEMTAHKHLPFLRVVIQARYVNKADISSLDFAVTRFSTKLFRTDNINIKDVSPTSSLSCQLTYWKPVINAYLLKIMNETNC